MSIELDAKRWNALVSSGRIRILGTGGLGEKHQHFGMEIWDLYPAQMDNEYGKKVLTEYADTIIAREKENDSPN